MDEQLWHAWRRERNPEAFRTVAEPAMRFAYDVARRMGCDGADADDAVQDCLIQLAHERSDEPLRVGLHAWMGRRVRFGVSKQRRGRSRRRRRERASARLDTVERDESIERRDEVEAALARLDADDRQLVLLRFLHDLDHSEIAYILNISPNACRIRVHRAVERLRSRLGASASMMVAALVPHRTTHVDASLKAATSTATTGALIMSTGAKMVVTGLAAAGLTAVTLFVTGVASLEVSATQRHSAAPRDYGVAPDLVSNSSARVAEEKPEKTPPFARGTCVLRIGDRYRFGDDRAGAADADLVCFDIRDDAVLATPRGAAIARMPLLGGKETPPVEVLYDALYDAPLAADAERIRLGGKPTQRDSGIALVRAADDRIYKLAIVSIQSHPDALRRRVTLRYASVSASEHGGAVHLPDAVAVRRIPPEWLATIQRLVEAPPAFRADLDWVAVKNVGLVNELPAEFSIGTERQIALARPLAGKLSITGPNNYNRNNPLGPALVYASEGIASDAKLLAGSWAVVLVRGDVDGEIETRTYAFIRITGNVTGTLRLRSYNHVIIDGTILGALHARSRVHVLVRGAITKPEAIRISSAATLYLEQPITREQIERMSIRSRQATIHAQHADLAPGEHEIGGAKVIVGDPIWNELR